MTRLTVSSSSISVSSSTVAFVSRSTRTVSGPISRPAYEPSSSSRARGPREDVAGGVSSHAVHSERPVDRTQHAVARPKRWLLGQHVNLLAVNQFDVGHGDIADSPTIGRLAAARPVEVTPLEPDPPPVDRRHFGLEPRGVRLRRRPLPGHRLESVVRH